MLKRLIAHQILKEKTKTSASLNLRDNVLSAKSDLANLLIDQLRDSFQSSNPLSGVFKLEETPPASKEKTASIFRQDLISYLATDSDKAFVDFTRSAVTSLGDQMAAEPLATGGYVVFAEYAVSKESFLMSALLNTTARPTFDEALNLVRSNPLDFEHLRHGARVRLKGIRGNREGVVQFFSQRADGVSDYFVEFLGCKPMVRPQAQGALLLNALNTLPVSEASRKKIKHAVYSSWSDARRDDRMMTLTEIAEAARPDDRQKVLQHLTSEDSELAGQFRPPSPSVMKQFVRFAFDGDGLRLEFDINPWANRVNVDEDRTLTITNVPPALVEQLEEI